MGTSWFIPISTARSWSTLAPSEASSRHLLVADSIDLAGAGHDVGIGGEHALDVGQDLAAVGRDGGGDGDTGGVGAAAAEGRDGAALVGSLKAGDHGDLAGVEAVGQGARVDRLDAERERGPSRCES